MEGHGRAAGPVIYAREKEKARKEEEMRLALNKKICCKGKGKGLPHAGATAAEAAAGVAASAAAAAEAAGGAAAAAAADSAVLGSAPHFACELLDFWDERSSGQQGRLQRRRKLVEAYARPLVVPHPAPPSKCTRHFD